MRTLAVLAASLALLSACDQYSSDENSPAAGASDTPSVAASSDNSSSSAPAAEDIILAEVVVPDPVPEGQDIMEGLAEGASAQLHLTCDPGSDTDSGLGTIMCGESYTVFYEAETSRWAAIGPNRVLAENGSEDPRAGAKNPGPPPSENAIVVWGRLFMIGPDGTATLESGETVGQLAH